MFNMRLSLLRRSFIEKTIVASLGTWRHFDEQSLPLSQYLALRIQDLCLAPMLSAFATGEAAFQAQRRAAGNRAQVIDLQVAGHGDEAAGADSLAHAFVEKRGDDAAGQITRMAFAG